MAIFHFSAKVIGRSQGRSATAAAAYRAGCRIEDRRTGQVFDYSRKRGCDGSEILAPDGAPKWVQDRAELWNRVEEKETRRDSQVCREIEFSLPRELEQEQMKALVIGFVQSNFVDRGMIADVAFHRLASNNPHAHVLLSMRSIDADGFGNKSREWNEHAHIERWREAWADCANRALDSAGHFVRIDHRSLAEQALIAAERDDFVAALGLYRVPTVHEGQGGAQERASAENDSRRTASKAQQAQWTAIEEAARTSARLMAPSNDAPAPAKHGPKASALNPSPTLSARPQASPVNAGGAVRVSASRAHLSAADRNGREAIRLLDERAALQAKAVNEMADQIDAEDRAREKWRRELQTLNELDQWSSDHMHINELNADQLQALNRLLEAEASTITDWLAHRGGDETRRKQEWQRADGKLKEARRVRDEWLKLNPRPAGLFPWRLKEWEEARKEAQKPVERAKEQREEADKQQAPEVLAELQRQQHENRERVDEIQSIRENIGLRMKVLLPAETSATQAREVLAPDDVGEFIEAAPTAQRVQAWRKSRQPSDNQDEAHTRAKPRGPR